MNPDSVEPDRRPESDGPAKPPRSLDNLKEHSQNTTTPDVAADLLSRDKKRSREGADNSR